MCPPALGKTNRGEEQKQGRTQRSFNTEKKRKPGKNLLFDASRTPPVIPANMARTDGFF